MDTDSIPDLTCSIRAQSGPCHLCASSMCCGDKSKWSSDIHMLPCVHAGTLLGSTPPTLRSHGAGYQSGDWIDTQIPRYHRRWLSAAACSRLTGQCMGFILLDTASPPRIQSGIAAAGRSGRRVHGASTWSFHNQNTVSSDVQQLDIDYTHYHVVARRRAGQRR